MKALAVTAYGRPLEPIDRPEPELRAGWAVIDVLACGLCYSDVKTVRGHMPYSAALHLPHVAGHEICGRVRAVAPGAPLAVGDRVVAFHVWSCLSCAACRRGEEQLCQRPRAWMGFTEEGGFQERLAVPVEYLLKIPDSIPDLQAPALTCAMGTAYRAVITRAQARPGDAVIVFGLGGVGVHAALLAQAAGALVIGVEVDAAKAEAGHRAGVKHAVTMAEAAPTVAALTGGDGADSVVDSTGVPALLEPARRLVRPGGRVVCVGYHVGEEMATSSDGLVLLEQSVLGSRYCTRDEMSAVIRLVAAGQVTPVIDAVLPLDEVNQALERLESGNVTGRLVLAVGTGIGPSPARP